MIQKSGVIAGITALVLLVGSATAQAAEFKAEAAPVIYKGGQEATAPVVFSTNAGTSECTTMTVSGSNSSASSPTAEVLPAFGAGTCKIFGIAKRSIKVNGCNFKFTLSTTVSGSLDITGCAGKGIELEGENCTVTVNPTTGRKTVWFSKSGGSGTGRYIVAEFEIEKLEYVIPAGCKTTAGTFTNGGLTGRVKIEGETDQKAAQGIWIA